MDVGLVCDSCSAFSPMGASTCVRCGQPVALEPARAEPVVAAPTTDSAGICTTCGAALTPGHRFCFNCGAKVVDAAGTFAHEETRLRSSPLSSPPHPAQPGSGPVATPGRSTMFFGAMQAARARLTLIRGDGLDGVSFTLAGDEHLAGRLDCPILFPEDPFLSPQHANFFYRSGTLHVRDEGSINGVFLRIVGSTLLGLGASFLVGEQLLTLLPYGPISDDAEGDGTYFYASPRRPGRFRLGQTLRGGGLGRAVVLADAPLTLGREGNDLDFPEDPFISGRHAEVAVASDSSATLTDLGSRNGTFVRVHGDHQLAHGDYVFIGQQLLRVEII
jgi:ribosomal protein L40E